MPRKRKVTPSIIFPTLGRPPKASKAPKPNFLLPSLVDSRKSKRRKSSFEDAKRQFPILAVVIGGLGVLLNSTTKIDPLFIAIIALVGCVIFLIWIASAIHPNLLKLLVRKFRRQNLLLAEIDAMPGHQFEEFVGEVFRRQGYRVNVTKRSRDQGADILLQLGDRRIVVQTKRQSSKVGNWAVQEIVASKRIYDAGEAIVVSNSDFTSPAIDLAEANGVQLINRRGLERMIGQLKNG